MADKVSVLVGKGRADVKEFPCKNSLEMANVRCKNGLRVGCDCGNSQRPCVTVSCAVKLTNCVNELMKAASGGIRSKVSGGGGDDSCRIAIGCYNNITDIRSVNLQDVRLNNRNGRRRSLRFDSLESSDSGVATLSSADSAHSSGTSDITEPASPTSSASSPSCSSLPSDHIHIGYEAASSPPSCQGSYDSGVEEATNVSPPVTSPENEPEKDEVSPCVEPMYGDNTSGVGSSDTGNNFDLTNCDTNLCAAEPAVLNLCDAWLSTSEDRTAKDDDETLCYDNGSSRSHFHRLWKSSSSATGHCSPSSPSSTVDPPHYSKFEATGSLCRLSREDDEPSFRCHWSKCGQVLPSGADIVDHIRGRHVDAQVNAESFVCLWEGCKVYNKASCSLSWLERHVLTHSGNKPFKCIVDGCGQRFTSQTILERHVNSHFNQPQSHTSNVAKRKDETPTKLMKKKKIRYRRTAFMTRREDFFDAGVMECLRHQMMVLNERTRLDLEGNGSSVTFSSTVIARQVENSGKMKVLLHWSPENIIPDEWVYEAQIVSKLKQTIPVSRLPFDSLQLLCSSDVSSSVVSCPYRKNRRK